MAKPRIIVVTGPTASGKTALALKLAGAVDGEIVSADSMQVYRYLNIGTAKPTPAERQCVPHHLIDVVDPDEHYSAGRFREEADRAIRGIEARGRVPVVVGGTALYLKALLHGLAAGPARDEGVRRQLEKRWQAGQKDALWEELRRVDPDLAYRVHPNDRTRILRGLEVHHVAGRPFSSMQRQHRFAECAYEALQFGMNVARAQLYARIDRRVLEMVDAGWVEEVRHILDLGFSPELPPLRSIGYREICAHLLGGEDLGATIRDIQTATRRFAKRQMTWFRRMELLWVAPADSSVAVIRAKKFLQTAGAGL